MTSGSLASETMQTRRLEAAHTRHLQVHQDHVDRLGERQGDGFLTVARLTGDLDVLLALEQHAQSGSHERLIVGEQDPDHCLVLKGRVARTRKPPPGFGAASRAPPRPSARSRMPTIP